MALRRGSLIGEYIRRRRQQTRMPPRRLAVQAGVSNSYLSQVERGLRQPSAAILNQNRPGDVQAGLLEDRSPYSDALAAIRGDSTITGRQRQVLIDIYESFPKGETGPRFRGPTRLLR
ncbi:helix-turn-helix transcriptional regulator [Sphaerisporangium sp. NPDC088356]|uniref:helix-turn-helix domain-containing protein n=1 Tax=Sphaerisporangium sp. NPDC088356 TaxID=3154871 RepID=UPI00343659B0